MYGIVVSALMSMLGVVFKSAVVKFVTFYALWFIVYEFIYILEYYKFFPTAVSLNWAFGGISSGLWYFLDLFALPIGLPMVISAATTRFIIRRIPLIG